MNFNIGDKVTLKDGSIFKYQQTRTRSEYGTIIRNSGYYRIVWVNGGEDRYPKEDVLLYEEKPVEMLKVNFDELRSKL